jgi:hypothetical protein
MKTTIVLGAFLALLAVGASAQNTGAPNSAPEKARPQWDPEEFGIGRKHTANARCNRQIDKILEENRNCFNTRPTAECDALMKKNSKKMGSYIRSPRCAK